MQLGIRVPNKYCNNTIKYYKKEYNGILKTVVSRNTMVPRNRKYPKSALWFMVKVKKGGRESMPWKEAHRCLLYLN